MGVLDRISGFENVLLGSYWSVEYFRAHLNIYIYVYMYLYLYMYICLYVCLYSL